MRSKRLILTLISIGATIISIASIRPDSVGAMSVSQGQIAEGAEREGHGEHSHGAIAVPSGKPIPSVRLIVHPDAQIGWNLEIQVENFRFAPERVNADSTPDEGHAHLFINGRKVTRLYGNWYYLPELPAGRNAIKVSLNTNRHETLMYDAEEIAATAIVEVP